MKLTAQVLLRPSPEQSVLLLQTLERVNAACNQASASAWSQKVFRQYDLHKICYYDLKNKGLSAQIVVRCIGKVADAYKAGKQSIRIFRTKGAITYDTRILSWKMDKQIVSIWTTGGRQKIPFACGDYQRKQLAFQKGETDLCYVGGKFYLFTTCEIQKEEQLKAVGWIGVDLGIKNIAVDSDGNRYEGGHLNGLRKRHAKIRKRLQQKGTKASKQLLVKRKRKESRMAKHVNHCIAKRLVLLAKGTCRGLALENLLGIRDRITVRRSQRRQHHAWSFFDLRQKIEYKAAMLGVPVRIVDPRGTSRSCPECGSCEKGNRRDQATFFCLSCGYFAHADDNAARNIASRAAVNQPDFAIPEMGLVKSLCL